MRPITTRSLAIFMLVAAALTLAACGNKTNSVHSAETEGVYLNVGKLKYQVQITRQLNPAAIPEDRTFVEGVAGNQAKLAPSQLWFAVFVRIENPTNQRQTPATGYTITDSEGNVFRPVAINTKLNPFGFSNAPIPPKGVDPNPDSVPGQVDSIGGVELLFKLNYPNLDNRPLTFHIQSYFPADEAAGTLDV
jgi:hypothetical protein